MSILVIDYETYFANDYTLSALTTEQYIRDPRFHAHMVGLKMDDRPGVWVPHHQIPEIFSRINWSQTYVLCHHAHFDCAILNWIYGIKPYFILDTLSMGRALFPGSSVSLASLSKKLLGREKGHELINTKGKWTLTPEEMQELGGYCATNPNSDLNLTYDLFQIMKHHMPISELRLIDMNVRLFTEPVLHLNTALLVEALAEERHRKRLLVDKISTCLPETEQKLLDKLTRDAIKKLGLVLNPDCREQDEEAIRIEVLSRLVSKNDIMALALESMGVTPPVKLSPAGLKKDPPEQKWVYAFAKSDEEFLGLMDHPDPDVPALVEARLGVKSTLKETRTERLIGISQRGTFPVYYLYYGAHSGRMSGGDRVNAQNFTRKSKIRESVEAPPGHVLVVRDASQVEARFLAAAAGQWNIIEAYAQGRDVYSEMATTIFGRKITKENVNERFIGKATILGAGYGMSFHKFQALTRVGMLGNKGQLWGVEMLDALGTSLGILSAKDVARCTENKPMHLTLSQHLVHCACAKFIITTYRNNNAEIVKFWRAGDYALGQAEQGAEWEFGVGVKFTTGKDRIWLPNGMAIIYPHLTKTEDGYTKLTQKGAAKIVTHLHGQVVVENLTQAISRISITDAMLAMKAEGMRVVMMTHDEIVVCCPENDAEAVYNRMGEIMNTSPEWCPRIALDSDGGFAHNYSK